jgi:hypothetical protein
MNIALTINKNNEATLLYDQPLRFTPAWVESSADGRGVRIVGENGEEYRAGIVQNAVMTRLQKIYDVLLVRMEKQVPVEGYDLPFVSQQY